jgi:outer membrane protein assembly factor BamB
MRAQMVLLIVAWSFSMFFLSSSTIAQDWPSFRGPNASGLSTGSTPPVRWNLKENQNLLWRVNIPGLGHSSPVIAGNRVYISTAVASEGTPELTMLNDKVDFAKDQVTHVWKLLALDRDSGKVLWAQEVYRGVPREKRHVKSSYANATPATNGRYIVVLMGSEVLACYDSSGKRLWIHDLGPLQKEQVFDQASSPIVFENLAILQNDRFRGSSISAFDLATGKQVWRTEHDEGHSWSTPVILRAGAQKRAVMVTSGPKFVRGFDPRTGKELWRMSTNDKDPWDRIPVPVAAGDVVYVTGGSPDRPIYAIRGDAQGDVSLSATERSNRYVLWSTDKGSPYMPTPILVNGLLFVVNTRGVLSAFDPQDGRRIFQERLPAGEHYSASPVAAGGNLYLTSDEGDVLVVRAAPKLEVVAQNTMDEVCLATPAISGGTIFIRTRSQLYAIGGAASASKERP